MLPNTKIVRNNLTNFEKRQKCPKHLIGLVPLTKTHISFTGDPKCERVDSKTSLLSDGKVGHA